MCPEEPLIQKPTIKETTARPIGYALEVMSDPLTWMMFVNANGVNPVKMAVARLNASAMPLKRTAVGNRSAAMNG